MLENTRSYVSDNIIIEMSEKDIEHCMQRCYMDATVKIGSGLAIGLLVSVLFTKRRAWPLIFGIGTGAGMAWNNCEKGLNLFFEKACNTHINPNDCHEMFLAKNTESK